MTGAVSDGQSPDRNLLPSGFALQPVGEVE